MSSSNSQTLTLVRGEDASVPVTAGTATDVTGWSIAFCCAATPVGPGGTQQTGFPLTTGGGGITVVTAASGVLRLTIPKATTEAMTGDTYYGSLWRTDTASSTPLAEVRITMRQNSGPPGA